MSSIQICGVDDAGRGAVIGPLVIAGILIDEGELERIVSLGVKDSKLISPAKRRWLAKEIIRIIQDHCIVRIPPEEIDKVVETGSRLYRLNRLEAKAMAEVLRVLKPKVAYVDASDVIPKRFARHIAEELPFKIEIISEHKADRTYPIVSAASILAKVERDRAIADLKKEYGDLGSGYSSDSKTIDFLEKLMNKSSIYPWFVRRSWKTAKRIKENHSRNEFQK